MENESEVRKRMIADLLSMKFVKDNPQFCKDMVNKLDIPEFMKKESSFVNQLSEGLISDEILRGDFEYDKRFA